MEIFGEFAAFMLVFTFHAAVILAPITLVVSTIIVRSIVRSRLILNKSSECTCGAYTNFIADLKNGYTHCTKNGHFNSIISSPSSHSNVSYTPGHSSIHSPSYSSSIHNPITSTTYSANPHNIHRR